MPPRVGPVGAEGVRERGGVGAGYKASGIGRPKERFCIRTSYRFALTVSVICDSFGATIGADDGQTRLSKWLCR